MSPGEIKMNFKKLDFTMYSLAIGLGLNLIFVIMFYWMIFVYQEPRMILNANSINEFWIDFSLLHLCLILISISTILEMKKYSERLKRNQNE